VDSTNRNDTPRGSRLHIGIFGRRNAGKSSLINALTDQEAAIVSDVPGTTTDPVYKAMEILPVGPVVIIDTAGLDDVGELGELRLRKTLGVLEKTDLIILVLTHDQPLDAREFDLIKKAKEKGVPIIGALNKVDLTPDACPGELAKQLGINIVAVSAVTRQGINTLKQQLITRAPKDWIIPSIVGDLVQPGDTVVLVVPIDLAAPKGRLILPQVQTIRDLLDNDCITLVVKERELRKAISGLMEKPKLVITDSQAFLKVDADTPKDVMMTSFSILFARYKGDLETLTAGALASDKLQPGDRVLIAEACTHHRVADDIGTVKIPRWLRQKVGGELHFDWSSGLELPSNLEQYQLIVHCGGCMINRKEMLHRILQSTRAGVPIVNYGVLIAHMHGILRRALAPFPAALRVLDQECAELTDKA
jgi:[FeFe] hydrogenase H-cluster maturation GTPase HydF